MAKSIERHSCFWCNWPVATWRFQDIEAFDWFYVCSDKECRAQCLRAAQRASDNAGITLTPGTAEIVGLPVPHDLAWEKIRGEAEQRRLAKMTRAEWKAQQSKRSQIFEMRRRRARDGRKE